MRNLILIAMLLIGSIGTAQTWVYNNMTIFHIDSNDCHLIKNEWHEENGKGYKNKVTLRNGIFKFNGTSGSKVLWIENRKDGTYYYCRDVDPNTDNEYWEGYIIIKKNTLTITNFRSQLNDEMLDSIYVCYN